MPKLKGNNMLKTLLIAMVLITMSLSYDTFGPTPDITGPINGPINGPTTGPIFGPLNP